MKKFLEIEVETTPNKKFFTDKGKPYEEDVTENVDKILCNSICEQIDNLIQDEDFEDRVLDSDEQLPDEIKEFTDFGSVKIMIITRDVKND